MKSKNFLGSLLLGGLLMFFVTPIYAQQTQEVVEVEDVSVINVPCKTYYTSTWKDNWFIQLGAGMQVPFVENDLPKGDAKRQITLSMMVSAGRWFSPYIGWRMSALGGALHWESGDFSKLKYANLNVDFMWDMLNSVAGVDDHRVFSIIPFVGLGGTYTWDINTAANNVYNDDGELKDDNFMFPVSAGLDLRFRLSQYVDIFVEGRAQLYGDNFNGVVYGRSMDINIAAIGGLTINIGGRKFNSMNPCNYVNYINQLNDQVNALRGDLLVTANALAAAEAQLPCPEAKKTICPEVAKNPMITAVRFNLNSAKISQLEMVNVYNVAEWLKANPKVKLVINGYADKDTGTAGYNETLSQERAQAVYDALVGYGISADRLTTKAYGSAVQPYENENNWNRIVLFTEQ